MASIQATRASISAPGINPVDYNSNAHRIKRRETQNTNQASPARSKSRRRRSRSGRKNRSPGKSSRRSRNHSHRKDGGRSKSKHRRRENKKFLAHFSNLIYHQKLLEEARVRLAAKNDFYPQDAFTMLDKRGNGMFSYEDFRQFVFDLGLTFVETRNIVDIYSSFQSKSGDNIALNYSSFIEMLKPNDSGFAARLINKMPKNSGLNPNGLVLSQECTNLLRDVFQTLFESRKVQQAAKLKFKERNLDFHRIFEKIDLQRKGFLVRDDFYQYLKDGINEFREGEFQEVTIFTNLCDLDNDGKVTFKDFYMFFSL